MADRYPLVVASGTIQEISSGDNLSLEGCGITSVSSVSSSTLNVTGVATLTNAIVTGILTATQNIRVKGLTIGLSTFSGSGVGFRTSGDTNGELIITMENLDRNITIGSTMGANVSGFANIAIGENALGESINAHNNIAIGIDALAKAGSFAIPAVGYGYTTDTFGLYSLSGRMVHSNTAIGNSSGSRLITGVGNVLIGSLNANNLVNGSHNITLGSFNLNKLQTGSSNIAIGHAAMTYSLVSGNDNIAIGVNGASTLGFSSCTHFGHQYNAITGDLQVQLNRSDQTVYAYGTVQNRSDERDKADIRDTVLGLDFINKLRPVDWRWDYRDAYVEYPLDKPEGVHYPKDGSRKRGRFHHGVIAQEVKEVIDELGTDFGGYQDHSVNGGHDTLTIGYDEFIGPMIKAIQELSARVESLENS